MPQEKWKGERMTALEVVLALLEVEDEGDPARSARVMVPGGKGEELYQDIKGVRMAKEADGSVAILIIGEEDAVEKRQGW
jgi:hypothetical protein